MNRRILSILGSPFLFSIFSVWGLDITLTSDDIEATGGLRDAINQINTAPGLTNNIFIPYSSFKTASQQFNLPPILIGSGNSLTIQSTASGGTTTYDGSLTPNKSFRGFFVYSGDLTVENMTIQNVTAQGGTGGAGAGAGGGGMGAGGAFFVYSGNTLTLNTTSMINAEALGGAGGTAIRTTTPAPATQSAGGGGGMGGNGGNAGTGSSVFFSTGGGGGGGLFGNGGNGSNVPAAAGGGGGGLFGNGGGGSTQGSPSFGGGGGGGGGSNTGSSGNGQTPSTPTGGTGGTSGGGAGGTGNVAQPASNGTDGSNYGGGGGGGGGGVGNTNSNGGNGGLFGGGGAGGVGFNAPGTSGTGGFGGGGGGGTTTNGGSNSSPGGVGGFGGGGGGSASTLSSPATNGVTGGLGGGGGGGVNGGTGGNGGPGNFAGAGGGGNGALNIGGGGGGAGLGGALFIYNDAAVVIQDGTSFFGNGVAGGNGGGGASGGTTGNSGQALGPDIFLMSSGAIEFTQSSSLTISSNIESDNGAGGGSTSVGGLTMNGTGMLTLSGNNTYTGKTSMDQGVLAISLDANLGNSSASLSFNGGTLQTTGSFSSARSVSLAGPGTFNVSSSSDTFTINGSITGSGSLTKSGPGTLNLRGINSYSGGTSLDEGEITLGYTSALGTAALTMSDGTTLGFDYSLSVSNNIGLVSGAIGNMLVGAGNTATLSGIISGTTSTLSIIGAGTVVLTGTNTYTGGTTLSAGQITIGNASALGTGSLTMSDHTALGLTSITASNAIAISSGTGTFFVDTGNTGTLSGVISGGLSSIVKTGTGTLSLSNTETYGGSTTIEAGTLALTSTGNVSNSSAVAVAPNAIFNVSAASTSIIDLSDQTAGSTLSSVIIGATNLTLTNPKSTFTGVISGAGGSLTKQGSGTFTLNGTNTYTGATTVSSGRLSVNGQLSSPVTVESGAILGGIGQILAAVTIQDGGTLRPGNSVGTLQVASLNLNPTSLTQIEVSPLQSSQIQVTGTANLDGALEIIFDPGEYRPPTNYTILTAGTVNGTFSNVLDVPADFKIALQYSSTSVILQLLKISLSLPVSQLSGNAARTASYLNSLPSSYLDANPELSDILVFDLSELSGMDLQDALISISPTRNSDGNFALQNTLFASTSVISNRLSSQRMLLSPYAPKTAVSFETYRPFKQEELTADADERMMIKTKKPEEHYAIWVDGFGEFSRQKAQNQNTAFHTDAAGVFLGFDFLREKYVVGLAAGYAPTSIHQSQRAGSGTVDSYLAMLYGTGYIEQFYLELGLLGSYNHFTNRRNVVIPPSFSSIARSEHNGGSITPHLGFGYDFDFAWATIEPYAIFNYNYNIESGYQERGAAPFNMAMKRRDSSMLRSELGMNFYQEAKTRQGTFIAREQLSWVNKKPFHIGNTTATFVGAPGFFTTTVLNGTQNLFSPALQLFFKHNKGFFLSATYEGEFGNGYDSNTILGKLGYAF